MHILLCYTFRSFAVYFHVQMNWFAIRCSCKFSVRFTHVITLYFSILTSLFQCKSFHLQVLCPRIEGGKKRRKFSTCKIYFGEFKTDFFISHWISQSSRVFPRLQLLFHCLSIHDCVCMKWVVVKECFLLHKPCEASRKLIYIFTISRTFKAHLLYPPPTFADFFGID